MEARHTVVPRQNRSTGCDFPSQSHLLKPLWFYYYFLFIFVSPLPSLIFASKLKDRRDSFGQGLEIIVRDKMGFLYLIVFDVFENGNKGIKRDEGRDVIFFFSFLDVKNS